jgi:putative SOS response-associated peptidase YedK
MCGRFTLHLSPELLSEIFHLQERPDLKPHYNIAPSQQIAAVRCIGGENRLDQLKWGLVPSWAEDHSIGYRLVNARSETVFEKHSFRQAIRVRRCLIPASGFYEWQSNGKNKIPYYIAMREGLPMAFAGIWEQWKTPEGSVLESCAILTTKANSLIEQLHDRMPVILHPDEFSLWLDREISEVDKLQQLFKPYPPEVMQLHPVSPLVDNPRNDTPECFAPHTE